jgi:hypothetical protein
MSLHSLASPPATSASLFAARILRRRATWLTVLDVDDLLSIPPAPDGPSDLQIDDVAIPAWVAPAGAPIGKWEPSPRAAEVLVSAPRPKAWTTRPTPILTLAELGLEAAGEADDATLASLGIEDVRCEPRRPRPKPDTPELQALRAFASQHGLTLQTDFPNALHPMPWRCTWGHIFMATPAEVAAAALPCDHCVARRPPRVWAINSVGEERTRMALQLLLGAPFPSVRPDFLRRESTGQCLELDGYCADLDLAFEYQGHQHHRYTPWFHANEAAFEASQTRDAEKAAKCAERGIDLLIVPHDQDPAYYVQARLNTLRREQRADVQPRWRARPQGTLAGLPTYGQQKQDWRSSGP